MHSSSEVPTGRTHSKRIGLRGSVSGLVDQWVDAQHYREELIRKWQQAEHQLSLMAKDSEVPFFDLCQMSLPETETMRTLMQAIERLDRELPNSATAILHRNSMTTDDTFAKLQLALALRSPSPDDRIAWSLVEAGYRELRAWAKRQTEAGAKATPAEDAS